MFCSEHPLLSVPISRHTIPNIRQALYRVPNIRSVNRMFGRAATKNKQTPSYENSRMIEIVITRY